MSCRPVKWLLQESTSYCLSVDKKHPRTGYTYTLFCSCDLDLDLDQMTLIYELDIDIQKMYPLVKSEAFKSYKHTSTNRQTDATECITMLYSSELATAVR